MELWFRAALGTLSTGWLHFTCPFATRTVCLASNPIPRFLGQLNQIKAHKSNKNCAAATSYVLRSFVWC